MMYPTIAALLIIALGVYRGIHEHSALIFVAMVLLASGVFLGFLGLARINNAPNEHSHNLAQKRLVGAVVCIFLAGILAHIR